MEALSIKKKIIDTLNNLENLSQEDIIAVYEEASTFGKRLSPEERGAFFWRSCFETLAMIVDGFHHR